MESRSKMESERNQLVCGIETALCLPRSGQNVVRVKTARKRRIDTPQGENLNNLVDVGT